MKRAIHDARRWLRRSQRVHEHNRRVYGSPRVYRTLLAGSQKVKPYDQRAQAETSMSMLKRNLGDALRSRSEGARQREMVFRSIVHNIMLIRRRSQRRDRAAATP